MGDTSDPQTFTAGEEKAEGEQQNMDQKSPSVVSFSEASLFQRKTTKGSSFIGSEQEKKMPEKNVKKKNDNKEKMEEVRGMEGTRRRRKKPMILITDGVLDCSFKCNSIHLHLH